MADEDEAKPAAQSDSEIASSETKEQDLPPATEFETDTDEGSLSDASDNAWDSETLAAVAKTTHHQMTKRQPILIGCNRDGSINVQLPNGNIIVAERSAFPKFDKKGPLMKIRRANRIKKDQFAYLTRKEKTYSDQIPTLSEIEHLLHLNASSIFHIFDRRVNLDLLSATCSNYELLRAWAQDDPYRYTPPSVDIPTDVVKEELPDVSLRAGKGLKLKRKATWNPSLTNISKALRQQSTIPSTNELCASMIQRGKHRRLISTQHISTSDEAVIAQMAEEGLFGAVQGGEK